MLVTVCTSLSVCLVFFSADLKALSQDKDKADIQQTLRPTSSTGHVSAYLLCRFHGLLLFFGRASLVVVIPDERLVLE